MKLFLLFSLIITSFVFVFLFNLQHQTVNENPHQKFDSKDAPLKSVGWQEMKLPENFSPSSVAFGERGEIALIGNDIRVSKDNEATWKIITQGKGYDRCSVDGGKTFDKKCDEYNKNPSTIEFNGKVNYNGDIGSPIIASDGRLYLSTFYEHHGALWSIPLENPKEMWFGLHFTYEGDSTDMKYWTTDTFITIKDKVFVSANSSSDDGFKWLTTDNKGKTWHQKKFNLSSDSLFIDKNNGIRITENQFEKTTDGKQTWQILQSPKTPDSTFSNTFVDDKTGFACGENGLLAITNDGGNSWHNIDLGIKETFYVVAALDDRNAWVAGGEGYIFETTDGGKTWQMVDLGFKRDIYSTFYGEEIKVDKFHRSVWIIKDEKVYRKTTK